MDWLSAFFFAPSCRAVTRGTGRPLPSATLRLMPYLKRISPTSTRYTVVRRYTAQVATMHHHVQVPLVRVCMTPWKLKHTRMSVLLRWHLLVRPVSSSQFPVLIYFSCFATWIDAPGLIVWLWCSDTNWTLIKTFREDRTCTMQWLYNIYFRELKTHIAWAVMKTFAQTRHDLVPSTKYVFLRNSYSWSERGKMQNITHQNIRIFGCHAPLRKLNLRETLW